MSIYFKTLGGQPIYQAQDIHVYQNLFYRWLTFEDPNSIQTLIHRRRPQKMVMDYILPFTLALQTYPGTTCLMGLGGGAVAHCVSPFLQNHSCWAIEAHAEVIAVAAQYFMSEQLKPFNIVHQKAEQFIQQTSLVFRHILIDIYNDSGFPSMDSLDFFQKCKTRLHPQGFLALNLLNIHTEIAIFFHLRQVFDQNTVCLFRPGLNNVIVLASAERKPLLTFLEARPRMKRLEWDSTFGCVARLE